MRYYAAIAAAAALWPTAAAAQSEQGGGFVGVHVEGLAGYEHTSSATKDGVLYGVGLCYDFGVGGLRLGVEGDATGSSAKTCMDSSAGRACLRSGRDLYVGARVGAEVSSNVLLYAKGGYANRRQSLSLTSTSTGEAGGSSADHVESSSDADGIRVGAGIEIALSRNAFVKAEYRYSHYEQGVVGTNQHQAVTGIGLRF
jgi:outer membrane immunogenic protein